MRFRVLRWIRTDAGSGQRQFREVFVQTRRLTIGRASDQHLQIADTKVFPNHAVIRAGRGREGAVVIEALTPAGVIVNGRSRIVANLNEGDEVRIGPAIIIVEPRAKGAPFTLRFRMAAQEGGRLDRLHVLSLSDSGLSKKFWSLMMASGVAAIFLIVPMAAALYQPLRPLLRETSMIPNDALWSPGPLHAAHKFIGGDCNACHTTPFSPIENTQCTNCHREVDHHVPVTSADVGLFELTRCGQCHVEHAETPTVVSRDQRLCTDCHGNLGAKSPKTQLLNVMDFGTNHPDFRVTMLQSRRPGDAGRDLSAGKGGERLSQAQRLGLATSLTASQRIGQRIDQGGATESSAPRAVDWTTVRLDVLPGVKRIERSNLTFSHEQHLAKAGIKGPDGDEVLQCGNCHQPDSSGRLMQPIQMEQHCSRCHSLRFDENDPATTVPHGDVEAVYRTVVNHFSRRFLESEVETPNESRFLRRPGGRAQTLSRQEQRRGRDWVEGETLRAARDLFEKRVCVDCHLVTKMPVKTGFQQWEVEPVKLTVSWMPLARFDHGSHRTSECLTCHKGADRSKTSENVLMPAIAECRACHGGAADTGKLPSDCLMCHEFHLPGRGLFDANATLRSEANPRTGTIQRMRAP